MPALIDSLFGPCLPAFSSMQAGAKPDRMRELCIQASRCCTLLLCLLGLSLIFGRPRLGNVLRAFPRGVYDLELSRNILMPILILLLVTAHS
jgi:hypothetical protein